MSSFIGIKAMDECSNEFCIRTSKQRIIPNLFYSIDFLMINYLFCFLMKINCFFFWYNFEKFLISPLISQSSIIISATSSLFYNTKLESLKDHYLFSACICSILFSNLLPLFAILFFFKNFWKIFKKYLTRV